MSTDLTKRAASALSIVPAGDIKQVIAENLGGSITATDLDRVKIPSGGGTAWEVPTLEGSDMVKSIDGIIIHHQDQNAYWPGTDVLSVPPECVSRDGRFGDGAPGGACATCPLNKFESAAKGRGKACKNIKVLFVLQPGRLLPMAIFLPPTSIPVVKRYLLQLTSAGVPFYGVNSRLTLIKEKNADGIEYSKLCVAPIVVNEAAVDSVSRLMLPAETVAQVRSYREAIIPILSSVTVDAEAVTE